MAEILFIHCHRLFKFAQFPTKCTNFIADSF